VLRAFQYNSRIGGDPNRELHAIARDDNEPVETKAKPPTSLDNRLENISPIRQRNGLDAHDPSVGACGPGAMLTLR
jgi:hypothetical protein